MAQFVRRTRPSSPSGNKSFSGGRGGNNNRNSYKGNNNRYKGNSSNNNRSSFGRGKRGGGRKQTQITDKSLYVNDLQNEVEADKSEYTGVKYTDYGLNRRLENNLAAKNFELTTEIQEKAIPMILKGQDVLGISATGSGKTGAFLIPLIEKLLNDNTQKVLIVAPTRELALQIIKEAITFVKNTHIQTALIIGGESMHRQITQLQRGGHIVVGTPGRINDLIKRGKLKANRYNNIVIDEVDRMLDMGFIADINFIYEKIMPEKQSLFFSATLNRKVEQIVASMSESYTLIKLANNTPTKSVVQSIIDFSHASEKYILLENILKRKDVEKAIIFVDTKRYADKIDKQLHQGKFKVGVIHGDKRQNVRKRVITKFKESKLDYLVATNVAARGLDIDDITHVINLDEPQTYDEYIHRIGRTGRNGSFGTAYTFVKRGGR